MMIFFTFALEFAKPQINRALFHHLLHHYVLQLGQNNLKTVLKAEQRHRDSVHQIVPLLPFIFTIFDW